LERLAVVTIPSTSTRTRRRLLTLTLFVAMCFGCTSPSRGDEGPLWEFGLGAGAVVFPDYRGADTSHVYPIPVPYFVYRGTFLRSDRNGLRELFLDNDIVELNLSVGATTPARSNGTSARAGMPDLKPTIEVGPSLDLHLWRSVDRLVQFDLRLPVRGAITIESSPHSIGGFFSPRLNFDIRDVGGHAGWDAGFLVGPLYANREYDNYFYTVAPQFATPSRPAYQAAGGYAGAEMLVSVSKRFPNFWVGAFVRHDTLSGATFLASPLVRSQDYWAGGFGIAWMIGKSDHRVKIDD